jgi:hypothetical protein
MPNQSKSAVHGFKPLRSMLVIGAPLSLAVLEIFHPHPHDLFQLDLRAWLLVHYLQIVLFPLSALAVVVLVRGCTGVAAALCRVAMFVFATSFVAFDTAAGVVTGIPLESGKGERKSRSLASSSSRHMGTSDHGRGAWNKHQFSLSPGLYLGWSEV